MRKGREEEKGSDEREEQGKSKKTSKSKGEAFESLCGRTGISESEFSGPKLCDWSTVSITFTC